MEAPIRREDAIRKAAELMRSGGVMLADVCTLCGSPLFRMPNNEVVCPIHGRVMLVKTEEEVAEASIIGVLTELEKSIANMLSNYLKKIRRGEAVYDDARDVVYWLDAIERIERIKKTLRREEVVEAERKKAEKESS
ncbi:MAG: hypothetical protein N3D82_02560 [Ignisphaera sp.]|nr:hypothetical protein [Ignisphaera sp.]MCX8167900.1 hypothetical protein [Ignisphaera sp.]MDW8085715.1 Sjogren's syndrome/scleroderma autoantigen 1 family protein [Ignisphaera sp.]